MAHGQASRDQSIVDGIGTPRATGVRATARTGPVKLAGGDLMLLGHAWHGQCRPVALMLPATPLSRCSACSGRLVHSTACPNAKRHPILTDRLSVERFSASYHTREKLLAWRLTPITFWSVSVSVP